MSADPIIYCLQQLTDYRQFERLCSDVMAGSGYTNIDPLGGTADRGRDALHVCRDNPNDVTIFAYTVRSDWHTKLLEEDCKRIKQEGHDLHRLVFVCTSSVTVPQKDKAKKEVRELFGWELELYDLERLRVRLASDLRYLVAQHPSIFCHPWFPVRGGLSISESHDTVVIDHVSSDHALATWLARRLQLMGYNTWCYGTAPLAGESADESVRLLIEKRAAQYLPILSSSATDNVDLMGRCGLACGIDGLTIPCWSTTADSSLLATKLRDLTPVRFDEHWSEGLRGLLDTLQLKGVTAALDKSRGRAIALRSYVPEPVTQAKSERVFANVFRVTVPSSVIVCELKHEMDDSALSELRRIWAFGVVTPTILLAFEEPPASVPLVPKLRLPEYSWADFTTIENKPSLDVVKELIGRNLDVACSRAGLVWCEDRKVFYFPHNNGPQRNVSYRHVDGRNAWVGVTGERSYGQGDRTSSFRYQLGPKFRIGQDEEGAWWVTMRIYVRITTLEGILMEKKAIGKRRKIVTKNWWNKEWFARTLGIMQAISDGAPEIEVGSGSSRFAVSTAPLEWDCPISIDIEAVERIGDFQEEMAAIRYADEDDENEDTDEVTIHEEKVDFDE
jgi:hypothetical protein